MPVVQSSSFNAASLAVDDLYIVVTPPGGAIVQGVATGIAGFVGGASWGPLNTPVLCGTTGEVAQNFGPMGLGTNDMPTDAILAFNIGAGSVVGVRVTDGTDVAAVATITSPGTAATGTVLIAAAGAVVAGEVLTATVGGYSATYTTLVTDTANSIATALKNALNANVGVANLVVATVSGATIILTENTAGTSGNAVTLTVSSSGGTSVTITPSGTTLSGGLAGASIANLTALYTGTEGNKLKAIMVAGSNSTAAAPTWTLQLTRTGIYSVTETFQNLSQASLGQSIINALANGLNAARGPSQLATATIGSSPNVAPSLLSVNFTGGVNGDANITTAQQIGSNASTPPTGMYALQNQGVQQFALSGNTDSNAYSLENAFGISIGALSVLAFPSNTTTSSAITIKNASGIDSAWSMFVNDWCQFNDTWNNSLRLISPAGFVVGKVASLSPQFSPGNKPIALITNTTRTLNKQPYSTAELAKLFNAGITCIINPCPGGNFFGLRSGINSSSNNTINGVEYTRMTDFLSYSLNQSFGKFIDSLQTTTASDPTRSLAESALNNFLQGLKSQNMIQDYSVDMGFGAGKVNTVQTVQSGFMNARVKVQYLNVVRFFVINLIAGRTVDVTVS